MAILVGQKGAISPHGAVARDLARALDEAAGKAVAPTEGMFSVVAYRNWFNQYAEAIAPAGIRPPCDVKDGVRDTEFGPVPVRLYRQPNSTATVVFVHGGAWIMGSVETHDHMCRWLSLATNSDVISVDYALAPEHPFPFAVEQVAGVLKSILSEPSTVSTKKVFVAGDSAGANIAAMAILRLPRPMREQLAGFVSIYGAYSPSMQLSSHTLFGDGRFGLSKQQMMWVWTLYAPHLDVAERQQVTPLGAVIDYFPPTLFIGAECDLLIDDTLSFYSHLATIGADVNLSLWAGITHGAMHFVGLVESVTSAAMVMVPFITGSAGSGGESTLSPMGRIFATAEEEARVQLPFLEADANLADHHSMEIDTPHLMRRSRQHGSLAHKLGSEIIKGKYAPGAILGTDEDGAAPGRSSFREAVRTLAAKGLVTAMPKVGTRVASRASWRLLDPDILAWHFESHLDEKFLRDAFELRKIAEPSAAALTALRMTPAIKSSLAEGLAVITKDASAATRRQGRLRFHQTILFGGENELLSALWPAIQVVLEWSANVQGEADSIESNRAYAEVFAKLSLGDAEGAMVAMAHLVDQSLAECMNHLRRTQSARS
mgnify:CR=1 FL=1